MFSFENNICKMRLHFYTTTSNPKTFRQVFTVWRAGSYICYAIIDPGKEQTHYVFGKYVRCHRQVSLLWSSATTFSCMKSEAMTTVKSVIQTSNIGVTHRKHITQCCGVSFWLVGQRCSTPKVLCLPELRLQWFSGSATHALSCITLSISKSACSPMDRWTNRHMDGWMMET